MPEATSQTDLDAAVQQWQETGWVLIDGLIARETIDIALGELRAASPRQPAGPTRSADEHVATSSDRAGRAADDETKEAQFRNAQFDGTTLFPFPGSPTLNALFVHPDLISFAEAALGEHDIRIYQSRVWSKWGGHTNYEQPMHRDGNHSLIPIRNVPGWWHLECFLYLNDVDESNGAPKLVPGSPAASNIGAGAQLSRERAPELYDQEVTAPGPAGSLLAYRSNVWHRGADMRQGTERHVAAVSFRPASAPWIQFDAHGPLVNSPDFVAFTADRTPRDLALFGVPLPGHEYWDHGVLDAMAKTYPALDLTPWRTAL